MTSFEEWLRTLDASELTGLLRKRPDVAVDPPPRTYSALAHLLLTERSVDAALSEIDIGAYLVLSTLGDNGGSMTRGALGVVFDEGNTNSAADVDRCLTTLAGRGLAWTDGDTCRCVHLYGRCSPIDGVHSLGSPEIRPSQAVGTSIGATQQLSIARMADTVDAVLIAVDVGLVRSVKAGGVGVREIRTLTKAVVAQSEMHVEVALELAGQLRLVQAEFPTVRTTTEYTRWLETGRTERMTKLIAAWWCSEESPTHRPQAAASSGKEVSVLASRAANSWTARFRQRMLAAIPDDGFADDAAAVLHARWNLPEYSGEANPADALAVWREASALGIVVEGRPTGLSSALAVLVDADVPTVESSIGSVVDTIVSTSQCTTRLLPDLTAVVTGPVHESIAAVLNSAAAAETKGAASTWRFGQDSVRGYFDRGGSAGELIGSLAELAATDIPQSLDYLIRDCARRYGVITVSANPQRIASTDPALLAEIVARRILTVEQVNATVLTTETPYDDVLVLLRSAGYSPAGDNPAAESVPRVTARPARPSLSFGSRPRTDVEGLADALVEGQDIGIDAELVATMVRRRCSLPGRDVTALADAIANGGPVAVDVFVSAVGIERDIVSDIVLDPWTIHAWSEHTQSRRSFRIADVRMVVETLF